MWPLSVYFVLGSYNHTICVWNADFGTKVIPALQKYENAVGTIIFSIDGTQMVFDSNDNTLWIWNVSSGAEILLTLQDKDDCHF